MKRLAGIENFRIIAALFVIANHTAMLSSISEEADFVFSYCLGRVAVPFFFMVSGYFVIGPWLRKEVGSKQRLRKFIRKTILLYALCSLLYVPVLVYSRQLPEDFTGFVRMVFFDGTYYHLWYFSAVIVGIGVIFLLKRLPVSFIGVVTALLYGIGVGGDLWYGAVEGIPIIHSFYDVLFSIFTYTRNGLFFAPFFLWLGAVCNKNNYKPMPGLTISLMCLVMEGLFTRHMGYQRFNSMYVSLIPVMWFLFMALQQWKGRQLRHAGDMSLIVYVIHPLVILGLRLVSKVIPSTGMVVHNSVFLFIATTVLSFAFAVFLVLVRRLYERKAKSLVCD